jgi:hypothetical protein
MWLQDPEAAGDPVRPDEGLLLHRERKRGRHARVPLHGENYYRLDPELGAPQPQASVSPPPPPFGSGGTETHTCVLLFGRGDRHCGTLGKYTYFMTKLQD